MPGSESTIYDEDYTLSVADHMEGGRYDLRIRLYAGKEGRPISHHSIMKGNRAMPGHKHHIHRIGLILALALAMFPAGGAARADDTGRIQPYSENPTYWQYRGRPVLLLGGSETDSAFQWTGEKLTDHLNLLQSVGGNVIRNVLSDRRPDSTKPFLRLEGGKYDLERWNEEYFVRLKTFLEETAKRDIIVHLTLWDPHDHSHKGVWNESPWNPGNNVTYTESQSGLPLVPPPPYNRFSFYTTVEDDNPVVLPLQRRFVDRVLAISLEFDHVLYNIMNETWTYVWEGSQWERHWAEHIKGRAAERNRSVHVTTMRMKPEASIAAVLEAPELYCFAEISQNNQAAMGTSGQAHWDTIVQWRSEVAARVGPRPLNNIKIYGGDLNSELTRNKTGTAVEAIDRFWRNILGGCASARFHRSESGWGIGLDRRAQIHIRSARMLTGAADIMRIEPRDDLLSDRDQNEAYCAAEPGVAYVVYFPDSHIMHDFPGHGRVRLDVSAMPGPVTIRWLNAARSEWSDRATAPKAEVLDLVAPTPDPWLAVVQSEN